MKIMVTGAAGFIGFHVIQRLLARGDTVLGVDNLNDYYDPGLKYARLAQLGVGREAEVWGRVVPSQTSAACRFVRAGFEDRAAMEAVFAEGGFDRVCHLGAQAGVRYSLENPRAYVDSNLMGFINILEACRQAAVPHLAYASSSSVYGLNASRPFSVHDRVDHPASLYAATKKANELMAHTYSHLYGLPTTGLRFFTVYGPWGRPDMAYFKFAEAMRVGRSIEVYNNGDMYRDFTYIDDIADGVVRVTDRIPLADVAWNPAAPDSASSSAPYRLYNIGNHAPVRLGDFIAELESALGLVAEKRYLPIQPGDVLSTEADVADLERDFGWKPSTTVADGLSRFAAWYRDWKDGRFA